MTDEFHLVIVRGETEGSVSNILTGAPRHVPFSPLTQEEEQQHHYQVIRTGHSLEIISIGVCHGGVLSALGS